MGCAGLGVGLLLWHIDVVCYGAARQVDWLTSSLELVENSKATKLPLMHSTEISAHSGRLCLSFAGKATCVQTHINGFVCVAGAEKPVPAWQHRAAPSAVEGASAGTDHYPAKHIICVVRVTPTLTLQLQLAGLMSLMRVTSRRVADLTHFRTPSHEVLSCPMRCCWQQEWALL